MGGSAPGGDTLPATTPGLRRWLRAEGVAAFIGGLAAWLALGAPWWLFVLLILVPDVSMVGYRRGPWIGAIGYNLVHNWATAGAVLGAGLVLDAQGVAFGGAVVLTGVLLVAHVGIDRAFGYGLKFPTSFQDTHLGRIGRSR